MPLLHLDDQNDFSLLRTGPGIEFHVFKEIRLCQPKLVGFQYGRIYGIPGLNREMSEDDLVIGLGIAFKLKFLDG